MAAQPETAQGIEGKTGRVNFNLLAFVAVAFGIVGLIGVFATYAGPLPLEREAAREVALDSALAAARGADPAVALEALRPRLDDSAGVLKGGVEGIEPRIAAERAAMRERFAAEAAATGLRLRWLIVMVTLMAFVFATTMLGGAIRHK
jgi:hypothetical protein